MRIMSRVEDCTVCLDEAQPYGLDVRLVPACSILRCIHLMHHYAREHAVVFETWLSHSSVDVISQLIIAI
jgi:hypothetical protein